MSRNTLSPLEEALVAYKQLSPEEALAVTQHLSELLAKDSLAEEEDTPEGDSRNGILEPDAVAIDVIGWHLTREELSAASGSCITHILSEAGFSEADMDNAGGDTALIYLSTPSSSTAVAHFAFDSTFGLDNLDAVGTLRTGLNDAIYSVRCVGNKFLVEFDFAPTFRTSDFGTAAR